MQQSVTSIASWMTAYLADLLEIPQSEVGLTTPFENFGLDSAAVVSLTSDLSRWVGMELESDLLFQCPDIESVARYVGESELKRVV